MSKHKKIALLITVLVVAILASAGWFELRPKTPVVDAATASEAHDPNAAPMFAFTGATDWTTGPHDATSMGLFGKKDSQGMSPCFAAVNYEPGVVNIAAELKKFQSTAGEGHTIAAVGTKAMTMKTPDGVKQYQLHQFHTSNPASATSAMERAMEGNDLGYLQLTNGYVKIVGNCETMAQLPTVIPALQALEITSFPKS
jgi:hypothetical protein